MPVSLSKIWDEWLWLPISLRLVVISNASHAIMVTSLMIGAVGIDGLRQASGQILLAAIVAFVVLRLIKHGWGAALLLTAGTLAGESAVFANALETIPVGGHRAFAWGMFASANVWLVIGLGCFIPDSSREPFRQKWRK